MFETKKSIVFITKNKISTGKAVLAKNPYIIDMAESDWNNTNLKEVFQTIKKTLTRKIRILLSEDLAYVVCVSIPNANPEDMKQLVQEKAQEFIPEDLKKTLWNYKEIFLVEENASAKKENIVQVVAIVKSFYENLRKAVSQIDVDIEALEPVSYALARMTINEKEPHAIVYLGTPVLLTANFRGLVVGSESIDETLTQDRIKEFLVFLKDRYHLDIKTVIFSGKNALQYSTQLQMPGIEFKQIDLNPMISLAVKKNIKPHDEKSLNLEIASMEINPRKKFNYMHVLPFAFFFILLSVIIIFLFYKGILFLPGFFSRTKNNIQSKNKIQANMPKKITPVPATSSAELDLSKYSVTILNGSKKEGEAGKLKTLLSDKGYTVIQVDNTDNSDYSGILLKKKEIIEQTFTASLDKILEENYGQVKHETLTGTEASDIIIIIGK